MSGKRPRVMVCFGTRPEVIKLAPVVHLLSREPELELVTVASAQHREMLDQMLETFAIVPDVDLGLMRPRQSLGALAARAIGEITDVIEDRRPSVMLVQGDTTTALCAALAAFYAGVPVGHVEAGLRTDDPRNPFPEEANRRSLTALARWHFAPTERSMARLLAEGVPAEDVLLTGNTVVDALIQTAEIPLSREEQALLPPRRADRRILVTLHRRETQGETQLEICRTLAAVASRPDVEIVLPVHLSPAVRASVFAELHEHPSVHLLDPLPYRPFVHLMRSADIILTDSGGIQEEAPTFGIPVLVMRKCTERPEGILAGCVRLSGTDPQEVSADVNTLLDDRQTYERMARAASPYGDGHAAQRIVKRLLADLLPTTMTHTIPLDVLPKAAPALLPQPL